MHQMCAAALVGRREEGARAQRPAAAAAPEAVRRGEPDPGEVGDGRDGPDRGRPAPAARRRSPRSSTRRCARRCTKRASRCPGLRVVVEGRGPDAKAVRGLASVLPCSAAARRFNDWLEGKIDYKNAGTLPPLEVPPDLTAPARDNRYAVPETGASHGDAVGLPGRAARAAGAAAGERGRAAAVERMRIERAGTQRWLVVKTSRRRSSGRWCATSGRRTAS